MKVFIVVGTRPEAITMVAVIMGVYLTKATLSKAMCCLPARDKMVWTQLKTALWVWQDCLEIS